MKLLVAIIESTENLHARLPVADSCVQTDHEGESVRDELQPVGGERNVRFTLSLPEDAGQAHHVNAECGVGGHHLVQLQGDGSGLACGFGGHHCQGHVEWGDTEKSVQSDKEFNTETDHGLISTTESW